MTHGKIVSFFTTVLAVIVANYIIARVPQIR